MTVERTDLDAYEMVMRMGLRARTAGTVEAHGMKNRESAGKRSTPEFAAGGRGVAAKEGSGGVGMAIIGGRFVRERPRLIVIQGGRK